MSAAARDAVHIPLDVPAFVARIAAVGIGDPAVVASQASTSARGWACAR
jgi:ethanolamine ammonia-lyase small subunit